MRHLARAAADASTLFMDMQLADAPVLHQDTTKKRRNAGGRIELTEDSAYIQTHATNTATLPIRTEAPRSRVRVPKTKTHQRTSTKRGSEPAAPPAPESSTSSHADTMDCGPAAMEGTGKETTVAEELMVGQIANGK